MPPVGRSLLVVALLAVSAPLSLGGGAAAPAAASTSSWSTAFVTVSPGEEVVARSIARGLDSSSPLQLHVFLFDPDGALRGGMFVVVFESWNMFFGSAWSPYGPETCHGVIPARPPMRVLLCESLVANIRVEVEWTPQEVVASLAFDNRGSSEKRMGVLVGGSGAFDEHAWVVEGTAPIPVRPGATGESAFLHLVDSFQRTEPAADPTGLGHPLTYPTERMEMDLHLDHGLFGVFAAWRVEEVCIVEYHDDWDFARCPLETSARSVLDWKTPQRGREQSLDIVAWFAGTSPGLHSFGTTRHHVADGPHCVSIECLEFRPSWIDIVALLGVDAPRDLLVWPT